MANRVSASQIAQRSGVSVPAVYLALGGRGRLGKATRQRILSVAGELRYRPNAAARAVRAGRFGGIALLGGFDGNASAISHRIVTAVERETARRNLQLSFALMRDEELTSRERVPKILRELAVDGLLINYIADVPPVMEHLIDESGLPAVWVNRKMEHDCIYADDEAGARAGTQRLVALGHRRIAFLRIGQSHHYSQTDRRAGYEQAMQEAGLGPRVLMSDEFATKAERSAWLRSWLTLPDRPTAVIAYERTEGTALLWEAMRLGLSVPEDLSIVCIGEGRDTGLGVDLSMMRLPQYQIGREAVALVEEKIGRPRRRLAPRVVALEWVEGETCGRPTAERSTR